MEIQFKNLTVEDQQIMFFIGARVSYLVADRRDAEIMLDAQESPSIMADSRGYVRGFALGQFADY